MKFISHRGNLKSITKDEENNPQKIEKVIKLGYDVEIDLRVDKEKIYLGHDFNQYCINDKFLDKHKNKLWIHAKNDEAIKYLANSKYNYFWHENDAYTITSKGFLWTHTKTNSKFKKSKFVFSKKTILTLPELSKINNIQLILEKNYYGICSDNIYFYKNLI